MKHSALCPLAAVVLATATFSPIAAAQTAAARDTLVGFFAQANYPSTSAPAPLQSYNSKGLTNEVRHDATGRWTVTSAAWATRPASSSACPRSPPTAMSR